MSIHSLLDHKSGVVTFGIRTWLWFNRFARIGEVIDKFCAIIVIVWDG
jgi:hypothetical protein